MNIANPKTWAVIFCIALLTIGSAKATEVLTITSPVELQVNQRNEQNRTIITISGTIQNTVDLIEAKATLGSEDCIGKSVDWTQVATGDEIDGGEFTGTLTLQAGGWYTFSIRARKGEEVVALAKILKVGVGEVFVTAGQSNSANYGRPRQEANDDRVVYYNGTSFVRAADPIPGMRWRGQCLADPGRFHCPVATSSGLFPVCVTNLDRGEELDAPRDPLI